MMQNPRVLIVADDLTGAMDSAGPFAGIGVETWVVAAPMQCDAATIARARVVSVNTDSRHLPAVHAATRVREIVRRLGPGAFDVVVKKIDSTLRGNVVAETLALLETSGRRGAVIAPAFPAQGRTVKSGVVHVNGVPLAETAFASDALSPPPLAPLQQVFAEARPGLGIAIAGAADDFSSQSDIRIWIAGCERVHMSEAKVEGAIATEGLGIFNKSCCVSVSLADMIQPFISMWEAWPFQASPLTRAPDRKRSSGPRAIRGISYPRTRHTCSVSKGKPVLFGRVSRVANGQRLSSPR